MEQNKMFSSKQKLPEGFDYAPIYRGPMDYINHPIVKESYLGWRPMVDYPHGVIRVSRKLSHEELGALEWANLPSELIVEEAKTVLKNHEYFDAYISDPSDAIMQIESILDTLSLKVSVAREKVKKELLSFLSNVKLQCVGRG